MAVENITFENKEALQNDAEIPEKNKVTDENINEIKRVINNNATELNKAQTSISILGQDNLNNKSNIEKLNININKKVDKIEGKDLSTNDFTNELKQKLENLNSYDDTEIKQNVKKLETEIQELQKDIQANSIIEETEQEKSLYIDNTTDARGKIAVFGNVEQETNLYKGALEQGSLSESGNVEASNRIRTAEFIDVIENTEIKVFADGANQYILVFYNTAKEYMSSSAWANLSTGTTIIANAKYVKIILRKADNSAVKVEDISNFTVGDTPSLNYPSKIIALGSNKNILNDEIFKNVKIEDSSSVSSLGNVEVSLENTKYSVRIYFTDGTYVTDNNLVLYAYNSSNQALFSIKNTDVTQVTNAEQVKYVKLSYNATGISTYLNKTISGIKLEKGEIATSYSPHGQGSTEISDLNKNLFNKNNVVKIGRYNSSGEFVGTSTWRYFEFNPTSNTDYTIQVKNNYSNEVYFVGFDKTGKETLITSFNVKTVTFNSQNFEKIGYSVEENELDNCQLEKGATATNCEEHKEQKLPLYTQKEMLTGDYFDLDRKKEVHSWEKYAVTGNENWSITNSGTDSYFYQFTIPNKMNKVNENIHPFSNFAKGTAITFANTIEGIWVTLNGTIRIRQEKEKTIEEFKEKLKELYDAGTQGYVYYKLAEPIELDLTEEQIKQLEQLNKLRFYKNINNIYTLEDIALLQATYTVDIQTELNNINSRLLSLEGN